MTTLHLLGDAMAQTVSGGRSTIVKKSIFTKLSQSNDAFNLVLAGAGGAGVDSRQRNDATIRSSID